MSDPTPSGRGLYFEQEAALQNGTTHVRVPEDRMTNKTVKELVEFLLGHATNCDLEGCPRVGEYFRQAATTLSQQAAEIEALREALRPFAAMAEWLDDKAQRRDAIYCGGSPGLRCEITNADYHKARTALTRGVPTDEN